MVTPETQPTTPIQSTKSIASLPKGFGPVVGYCQICNTNQRNLYAHIANKHGIRHPKQYIAAGTLLQEYQRVSQGSGVTGTPPPVLPSQQQTPQLLPSYPISQPSNLYVPQMSRPQVVPELPLQPMGRSVDVELSLIQKNIKIDAVLLLLYDYSKKCGYVEDFGTWLTELAVDFFKKRGLQIGVFSTG